MRYTERGHPGRGRALELEGQTKTRSSWWPDPGQGEAQGTEPQGGQQLRRTPQAGQREADSRARMQQPDKGPAGDRFYGKG